MLRSVTLDDKDGNPVTLHAETGKRGLTNAHGLVGVPAPRASRRVRPTGHGGLDDTKWTDGSLVVLEGSVVSQVSLVDAFAEMRAITKPMLETLDYGPALVKWTEGADNRQGLTNLIKEPSFELGIGNWIIATSAGSTATLTQTNAWAADDAGEFSGRLVCTSVTNPNSTIVAGIGNAPGEYLDVTPGTTLALGAACNTTNPGDFGVRVQVVWRDITTASLSTSSGTFQPGTGVKRPVLVATAPANAVYAEVRVGGTSSVGAQLDVFIDAVVGVVGTVVPDPFDGDSEWAYWNGGMHASTSTFDHSLQKMVKLASDIDPPLHDGAAMLEYQAQFFAPDPRAYHVPLNTVTGSALSLASGGLTFPMRFPVKFTPSGGGSAILVNKGNRKTPPVFRVYGACSAPQILNVTTGETISLANGSVAAGDFLEVDVANRTVKLNGTTNQLNALDSANTTWFELGVGTTVIRLLATSFDGTARCDVLYRHAYA